MDKIGILIELTGDKLAINELKEIKERVNELKNVKIDINFTETLKELKSIKTAVGDVHKELKNSPTFKLDQTQAEKNIEALSESLGKVISEAQQGTEVKLDASKAERSVFSLKDAISQVGQAISGLGSISESIGGIFSTDFLDTMLHTVTVLGTVALKNSLSSGAERYDIMTTYADYLGLMGYTAEQAQSSLDTVLDEKKGILGLPIQTSDIAYQIRLWDMYRGNLEETTNLALGFNKALIAGGASEQMRSTSEYELMRLLTTGELATTRQWNAMLQGLGVSTKYIKEVMGYGDLATSEFSEKLAGGDITTEEFLQGLVKLADSETLDSALDIYRGTIESATSNIQYAFTRGWEETLQVVNETLESETGKGIVDSMNAIRDEIDSIFDGVQNWIKENPDEITQFLDNVLKVVQKLEQFDWSGLARSIGDALDNLLDILIKVYDKIPPDKLEKFLTFALVYASPLGKALRLLGSSIQFVAKCIPANLGSKIGSLFSTLFGLGGKGVGKVTGTSVLTGIGSTAAFIGVIAEIGAVVWEYAEILNRIGELSINWDGVKDNMEGILNVAGVVAGAVGTITGILAAVSALTGGASSIAIYLAEGTIAAFIGIIAEIGATISVYADSISDVMDIIKDLSKLNINWHKTKRNVENMADCIVTMADTMSEIEGMGLSTTTKSFAAISMALAFGNVVKAMEALEGAELPDTEKIDDVLECLKSIDEAFDGNFYLSWAKAWDASNMNTVVTKAQEIMDNLTAVLDSMKAFDDKMIEYGISYTWVSGVSGAMKMVVSGLLNVTNSITGDDANVLETSAEAFKSLCQNVIIKTAKEILKNLQDITDTFASFDFGGLDFEHEDGEQSPFDRLKRSIKEIVYGMQNITEAITGEKKNSLAGVLKSFYGAITNLNIQTELNAFTECMDSLVSVKTKFDEISTVMEDFDQTSLDGIITALGSIIKSLQDLFTDNYLQDMYIDQTAVESFANLEEAVGSLANIFPVLRGMTNNLTFLNENHTILLLQSNLALLRTAFGFIPDNASQIAEDAASFSEAMTSVCNAFTTLYGRSSVIQAVSESGVTAQIGSMIRSLASALDYLAGIGGENGLVGIGEGLDIILEALQGIEAIDLTSVIEDIGELKSALDALNVTANRFKATLTGTRTAALGIISALGALSAYVANNSGMFSPIISSAGSLRSTLSSAASSALALARAIGTIPTSKTVTVNYSKLGQLGTTKVRAATGGLIGNGVLYRANGGFTPKGTDTVPAMLTPGEYVMKKKAVQAYGTDFMSRLNNMDIDGAMQSLMSRVSVLPAMRTIVNNNSVDNHATVNQYITTENPMYSYRRASRYVRAL